MREVTLRSATEQDSEWVFLVKKAALGKYIEQTWGWDEDFQRQFHANDYDPVETQIIVEGGSDVGWMIVSETETEVQLQEIYIHPDYQHHGIGSHLVGLVLAKAETQKKPVRLQVLKVNQRARQLYERLGLGIVGETDKYYLMSTTPG
jgi:ribosomal protein S18 acetylase RimI-like enzyme